VVAAAQNFLHYLCTFLLAVKRNPPNRTPHEQQFVSHLRLLLISKSFIFPYKEKTKEVKCGERSGQPLGTT